MAPRAMNRPEAARLGAGLLISAVFLGATLRAIDAASVWDALRQLSIPVLGLTLGLCLLEIAARAYRWKWLLQPTVHTSVGSSFAYICVGHFANTLLPFRLGDAARAYLAASRFRVSSITVLGTIVVERLADGILLLVVVGIGILFGIGSAGMSLLNLVGLSGIAFVGVLGMLARRHLLKLLHEKAPRLESAVRRFEVAFGPIRSPQAFARLLATTLTSFALAVLILHMALSAAGTELEWWATAMAISAMTLSTAVPAAPGSVGTYEFVGTAVLTALGVPAPTALTAVIVVHVLAAMPPALIGLATTLTLHFDVLRLRQLRGINENPRTAVVSTDPA